MTRRELLTAAGATVFGATIARTFTAEGGPIADELNQAAVGLEPAERLGVPDAPLADGEILFPIEVGSGDYCFVIDGFGDCRGAGCSRTHEGVDIIADQHLPIRAPSAGELIQQYVDSGKTWGAGHGWKLEDDDGTVWKFFHMDRHAEGLSVGDRVEFGQTIGFVGNTGTSGVPTDTNHHLHFEYRPGNVPADPFPLLQRDPDVQFEA